MALFLALLGCGEPSGPSDGSSAEFASPWSESDRQLNLAGTATVMGATHGRVFRDRIRALRDEWLPELIDAGTGAGDREAFRRYLRSIVDQVAFHLPEALREELDAMADAAGLEPLDLLELEVARDAVRMRDGAPRMSGAFAFHRAIDHDHGGPRRGLRVTWHGPDARRVTANGVRIVRVPSDGRPATICDTWPGMLGGIVVTRLAGTERGRSGGRADADLVIGAAEVEVPPSHRGFGTGLPLSMSLRIAAEASEWNGMRGLGGSMGHVAFAFDPRPGADPVAVVGTLASVAPDDVVRALDATGVPVLVAGPHANLAGPEQTQLDERVAEAPESAYREFAQLADVPDASSASHASLERTYGGSGEGDDSSGLAPTRR